MRSSTISIGTHIAASVKTSCACTANHAMHLLLVNIFTLWRPDTQMIALYKTTVHSNKTWRRPYPGWVAVEFPAGNKAFLAIDQLSSAGRAGD